MFMNEIKFLDKIKFNKNHHPFKESEENEEINFWWQQQIQDLISFYTNDEENAKRFKINCILANNWGWKTRFFEAFENQDDENMLNIISKKSKWDKKTILEINEWDKNFNPNIIWDNFSAINKEKRSVNNNVLSWNWLNQFYLELYNFLSEKKDTYEKEDINKIFSEFTNSDLLNKKWYKIIISTILEKYEIVIDEIINELWSKYNIKKDNTLNQKDFRFFLNRIYSYNWFWWTFQDYNIWEYNNIKDLLENNDNFFYHYLFVSWIISEHLQSLRNKPNNTKENNDFSPEYSHYHRELLSKKRKQEIDKILELPFNKMINNLYKLFTKKTFFEIKLSNDKIHFSKEEIRFFSKYYKIDFQFKIKNKNEYKSFEDLSSWEQVIIARFTNIYRFLKWKRTNIILIDEPDLHLHLDWQRQYIKILIDIFSKLNSELDVFNNTYFHFILATHSPFIVSDLPNESIILLDKSEKNKYKGKFTEIKEYENKSFWANYVDLIRDWFFFENKVLMWSFAESNIKNISIAQKFLIIWLDKIKEDCLNEKEKRVYHFLKEWKIEKIENFKKYVDIIWDDFLKNNLLYL